MRVAIDTRISRTWDTGIGRYTVNLADALGELPGCDSLVLLVNPAAPEPRLRRPVEIVRTPIPVASIGQHLALGRALRAVAADIVLHTHPLAAPLRSPIPSVIAVLDLYQLRYPRQYPLRVAVYYQTVVRLVARLAARIVAISEATKRDVVDMLGVPADGVEVTPLAPAEHFRPVPASRERAAILARLGLTNPYILYHGNKRPHKNLLGLVRAFGEIADRVPHIVLAITGPENPAERDHDSRPVRAEVARLAIDTRIRFVGHVDDQDLPAVYSGAVLTAVPSFVEGFGLTAVESLACGTPVISSTAPALLEVVGDAALIVDPRDVTGLVRALTRLIDDRPLREALSEKALLRARRFTWRATAEGTLAALESARRER